MEIIKKYHVVFLVDKLTYFVFMCLLSCFVLSAVDFAYPGQENLFKNLDFGIDMESRSESVQYF